MLLLFQHACQSLRLRLLLLGIVASLPAFVLLSVSAIREQGQVYANAKENDIRLARIAAAEQRRYIDEARELLTVLAELPEVRSSDLNGCDELLAELKQQKPRYANLGVADLSGTVRCSAVPQVQQAGLTNRSNIDRVLLSADFAVGEYLVGKVTGKPSLPVAYPVRDSSGNIVRVVYAAIDLAWLSQLISDIDVPTGTIVALLDSNATILSRYPHPEQWAGRTAPNAERIRSQFASGQQTGVGPGPNGVDRLFVVTRVPNDVQGRPVYLGVGIPIADTLAAGRRQFLLGLGLLALVSGLGLASLWFGSGMVLRQLQAVIRATQRLSAGDLSTRTGLHAARGEVAELARSVDHMAESLQRNEEQLRENEQRMRQMEKMDAIGRLAGGIAHDFNNLLTAIIGCADLAIAGLDDRPRERELLDEIVRAGEHAAELTSQLLIFSRRKMARVELVDLNELVRETGNLLRRLIGEDIALATVLAAGIRPIRADRTQIEQIILNLATNGRDAMPSGGKLTIETASVELDEGFVRAHPGAQPGPHVMLAVSDTGVGIDRETMARMFEPFFTTKPPSHGTGLGLSTVLGIAQDAGGTIWAYSEPGWGTTLKVYLPVVPHPEETKPIEAIVAAATDTATGTILLVEDEAAVRRFARTALEAHGYQVLEAGDAITQAEGHTGEIDLLLTDLVLPGPSGREIADEIGQLRPGVPVLFMSGYTDDTVVRHGLLAGDINYLGKPFSSKALVQKVNEVLKSISPR